MTGPALVLAALAAALAAAGLTGCSSAVYETRAVMPQACAPGIYHKVQKGETLWRIAKAYGVSMEDIARCNGIPDTAQIEVHQLLMIPGAKEVREIPAPKEDLNKEEFAWPLKGKIVRYFGERSGDATSQGIEIEAREGQQVLASRQGKVVFADYLAGYADTVIIDHQDGFDSVYAHNARLLVKPGDFVYKGDPIAQVGKSGSLAYLYFEIRKNGLAHNPLYYLP